MNMKTEPGEDKIRQYEAVVELANREKEGLLDESSINTIKELIQDIHSRDDPIYHVNCLQLVADLACSNRGLALLEKENVPQKLIDILNLADPIVVPHALKFFYRVHPTDLETKYPKVLDKICDFCQSDDRQLVDYAVDLIAAIGRGGFRARQVLIRHPEFKKKCLSRLGSTISCADSFLKGRTLKCIEDLLELHEDDPIEEASALSEELYHSIITGEQRMTEQLFSLCKVPFMEVRINAMLVVAAIAIQEWGQKELAAQPEFLKWMLNRSTEICKEGKEAKFEILKTIVKSKTASRYFKGEDFLKLRADFKNGPFHVGVAEEMLLDEQQAT